jgi:uncharacterized membrane protein
VVFALFLAHSLAGQWFGARKLGWPEIVLLIVNPFGYFGAVYVLLNRDYSQWLGTVAIVMAAAHVMLCRLLLVPHRADNKVVLAALAVVVGFIGLAFPIQADAAWVALGWAAVAAALWWFGCRIQAVALRGMAGVLAVLAAGKLVAVDTPRGAREMFVPIFNEFGLPAVIVAGCVLGSIVATRRFHSRLARFEQWFVGAAGICGMLLLLYIFTVETHGFFTALALGRDTASWRWIGQMAISILWATFAAITLSIGMWRQLPALRWLALGLFAVTACKVFLVDMATLHAFYRILAFLVLSLLLAGAARAYQRLAPRIAVGVPIEGSE